MSDPELNHAELRWHGEYLKASDKSIRLERDLSDALATLRDVQDYLERGVCRCMMEVDEQCHRCRLLGDVKTTIANCGP